MSNEKNLPKKQENQGITWKINSWGNKTTIFYAGKEIGFFKMNMWSYNRGEAMLLDREFEIKTVNIWGTKVLIIDKIDERVIATLKIHFWSRKTELYVEKDNETFIFRQNMWKIGKWWWERKQEETELLKEVNSQLSTSLHKPTEKLIQNKILDFFETKGEFDFGNVGESNLNALILGGIFIMTKRKQSSAGLAGAVG